MIEQRGWSAIALAWAATLAVVAVAWLTLRRKRVGFRNWGDVADDELTMPCQHPTCDLSIVTSRRTDGMSVALVPRCLSCGESMLDAFVVEIESDGRIVITNATTRTIPIVVARETYLLEPRALGVSASHVARPFAFDDDEKIGPFDEGDKS